MTSGDGLGARAMSRKWDRIGALAAMLMVGWFFHWVVANNNGFDDWGDIDYYKLLVRGWRKGQLNLDKDPAPELLALPDPYDPAQNGPYKLGDVTLYRGKYYIYFGPAPALTVMLPWSLATGRELTTGAATFVFCSVALLTASLLWLAIRSRYFPDSHPLIAPLGVLALGFGTHLLSLAQRPMMWELPISAGIAFTLLAVAAVYRALHGPRPVLAMAAAGLLLGLAVGSRPTCLLAAGILLVPVWRTWRQPAPGREWWRLGLAAGVPLALCGLAIMAHNYARFDNPLEWGQNYQLSGAYESKLVHFSHRFFLHNFSVYFFQPLQWSSEFPFAFAQAIEISHIPDYFGTEEVCGLAVSFPYLWFLLALPLAWWRRPQAEAGRLGAAAGLLAAYVVPVGVLVLCYFSTTMRYQTDYAVALAVIALVGLLAAERAVGLVWPGGRGWVPALALATCLVTVGVGTLATFDYHGRSMRILATEKWQRYAETCHDALSELGRWLGRVDGPQVLKVRFRAQPEGHIEPFWQATDPGVGEQVFVQHRGANLVRFGYARGVQAIAWGRDLRWREGHSHTVSVQVPSLYRPDGHGWWSGARRDLEFRERTGISVWFSGGRALGLVREPLAGPFAPGGGVSAVFSGQITGQSTRLLRRDEFRLGLVDPADPRGGVFRGRVVLPDRMREAGEPIFAAGAHMRSNILFVEPAGSGMKFTYETYTQPRVFTPMLVPGERGHVVEFEMASLRPDRYGIEGTGDVVVRVDGREMIRTPAPAYHFAWGNEGVGRNPFGTTCGDAFRGWILEARWVR
jgi:hypothetical protein